MTQVKVCGLTREADVRAAAGLGAAYVGFNFAAISPRRVTLEQARRLASCAGGALRVGVFVYESRGEIEDAVDAGGLDVIQIHRPLRGDDLDLPRPVIAVLAGSAAPLPPEALTSRCHGLLLDSDDPRREAGGRRALDWSAVASPPAGVPVLLAGGLDPGNVGEAIQRVRPAIVDVASGIESTPGVKDHARMRRFFDAVRDADAFP